MRSKRKFIIAGAAITAVVIIAALVLLNHRKNSIYRGNGIVYIVEDNDRSGFLVFNSEGVYEERIGSRSETFWLACSVYEDETVSADNRDNIYRFTEQGIERFENVETGIMAVLKSEEGYVLISQTEDSVCVSLYSDDFNDKLNQQEVPGIFQHCHAEGDSVYYSVCGDKEAFTGVYRYGAGEKINERLYYNSEASEEIYPFLYGEKLYLAKNKLISQNGNQDILKVCEMQADGELLEISDMEEPLKKVVAEEGEIYALSGVNSAIVSKINLSDDSKTKTFSLDDESALGLYVFEGKIYALTDRAIYELKGDKLLKRQEINAVNTANIFY